MRRWVYEIYGFVGYVVFFLIAGLIACPFVLLLLRLNNAISHWPVSLLVSAPLRILCYVLIAATLVGAVLVTLAVSIQAAQWSERRRSQGE